MLEVDVEADQVEQLERPHAEAAAEADDAVDRRRVGDAVAEHPQRLQREGAGEAVGDEAGAVLGADRRAAHPLGDLGRRRQRSLGGPLGGDDLDQLHQRRRVEEVHADDALGVGDAGGDRRHPQRGGVGGEDRSRARRPRPGAAKQLAASAPGPPAPPRSTSSQPAQLAELGSPSRIRSTGGAAVVVAPAAAFGALVESSSPQPSAPASSAARARVVEERLVAAQAPRPGRCPRPIVPAPRTPIAGDASPALELGLALLEEGLHPLDPVLGRHRPSNSAPLLLEARAESVVSSAASTACLARRAASGGRSATVPRQLDRLGQPACPCRRPC